MELETKKVVMEKVFFFLTKNTPLHNKYQKTSRSNSWTEHELLQDPTIFEQSQSLQIDLTQVKESARIVHLHFDLHMCSLTSQRTNLGSIITIISPSYLYHYIPHTLAKASVPKQQVIIIHSKSRVNIFHHTFSFFSFYFFSRETNTPLLAWIYMHALNYTLKK